MLSRIADFMVRHRLNGVHLFCLDAIGREPGVTGNELARRLDSYPSVAHEALQRLNGGGARVKEGLGLVKRAGAGFVLTDEGERVIAELRGERPPA